MRPFAIVAAAVLAVAAVAYPQAVVKERFAAPGGKTAGGLVCWTNSAGDNGQDCVGGGLFGGTLPYRRIYIGVRAGVCTTTLGCSAPVQIETASNKINYVSAAFDLTQQWQLDWVIPLNYVAGTAIIASVDWVPDADVTGGSVGWVYSAMATRNRTAIDAALGSAITVTQAWNAAGQLMQSPVSAAITAAGTPQPGDHLFVQVARNSTTLAGGAFNLANMLGVYIAYQVNKNSSEG